MENDMRTKPFTIATMALMAAFGMALCTPLTGCSGCSTNQGSHAIEKPADSKSIKKEAEKTKAQKGNDSASSSDTETAQEATAADASAKANVSENKSSTPAQTTQGKTYPGKSDEANGSESKHTEPQKKWVPEQGHWETDYGQIWVPNIVYTRHERCICTACGAVFDSKSSFYAHSDTMWAQGQDHGGYVDDSYTTTEDKGHYEQQATGQYWVITPPGIGSRHLGLSPRHLIILHSTQRTQRTTYSQGHAKPQR